MPKTRFQQPMMQDAPFTPAAGPTFMSQPFGHGCCPRPQCPTIVQNCPPTFSCSQQVLDQYHITKKPHIHNFNTHVVHHHLQENIFIPQFSCSESHVMDTTPGPMPFMQTPMPMGPTAPIGPAPFTTGPIGPGPVIPGPLGF